MSRLATRCPSTATQVATVVRRRFGVLYRYPSVVANLLHRLGFTMQKPARRAVERDEQAITDWRAHLDPTRGTARARGAWICCADESGLSLIPPVRTTWAPRGRTP